MPDGSSLPDDATFAMAPDALTISLRILATTDLHMNLGAETRRGGLARLAPMIAQERGAHDNLLLFDNGDLLDGTALGDELARAGLGPHDVHPAIGALNRLGYDAATLGNHDFAHGVAFLRRAAADARYPLVLANAGLRKGAPIWTETVLLHRHMRAEDGSRHDITVGVFGVLPPQTVEWEAGLSQDMMTEDIIAASRRAVSSLRARGADVIVALSHGGLGTKGAARPENAADAIAEMAGVDAVIAGHTHEVIVRPATPFCAAIVKAGFGGSHLAAISLNLTGQPGAWHIACTGAEALPAPVTICTTTLAASAAPEDNRRLAAPIGAVGAALSSHFSLLGVDAGLRLTEAALCRHLAAHLPGCTLPVLTAMAPFRTGGRGGPDHFVHIPSGPISRGDLSALYPFTNHVAAIELTGAEIAEWLERAAQAFTHLPETAPGAQTPLPLMNANIPGFHFDMIGGLDYEIDLHRPAAFDANGQRRHAGARVRNIRHNGQPLRAADRFMLLTNSYRMAGGAPYAALTGAKRCRLPAAGQGRVRDIIARHLGGQSVVDPGRQPFFRLRAAPGTHVWFDTAPEAAPAACPLPVTGSEITESGFQRLTIRL